MNRDEVIAAMQEVFDGLFLEPVVLRADLTAKDVQEWDSFLHISLVVAIEKRFEIRFQLGEVEATKNVGEFADLIVRRLNEAQPRTAK